MARLKFRTDGTIALFDPSDDPFPPFPPFPPEALLHLPPTLPSQAADQAQPQLPTGIPPAQAQADLPAVQSEAAANASSLALELTPALTQAEEVCPRPLLSRSRRFRQSGRAGYRGRAPSKWRKNWHYRLHRGLSATRICVACPSTSTRHTSTALW